MRKEEISFNAEVKELERLEKQLERRVKALEKAQAKADKLGVSNWTQEERNAWLETIEVENGFIVNKADVERNGAWFGLILKKGDVAETERAIEKCKSRLEKKEIAFNESQQKIQEVENIQKREDLIKQTFEEMAKEWLKDGIVLKGATGRRYWGETPKGKRFFIEGNSYGYTTRSLHCYTLTIDGHTVFTSGLFWRAYHVIKNN